MPNLSRCQVLGTMTAAGAMIAAGEPAFAVAFSSSAGASDLDRRLAELERADAYTLMPSATGTQRDETIAAIGRLAARV